MNNQLLNLTNEMTRLQRKQLEGWIVVLVLFLVIWLFQDTPVVARGAFLPAIIYLMANWGTILYMARVGPTPTEVLTKNTRIRMGLFFCIGVQLTVAYFFLFTGRDLGEILTGYGSLTLAVLFPILPAVIISEFTRFRRLGKITPEEQ